MLLNQKMEERLPGTLAYADKRRQEIEKYDIQMVNQQLQRIVKMLPLKAIQELPEFKKAVAKANQHVLKSTVLNLSYGENYESKHVAFATMEFLFEIMPLFNETKTIQAFLIKLDRPKRLLLPLDSGEMNKISRLELKLRQTLKQLNQA